MTTPTPPATQGPSGGRGTVHGDLSQLAGRPQLSGLLYYAVLLVAAGIDIATFYQVLALVMRNVPDVVVWLGVVGFTVTALALAHTMGVRMRDRVEAGGRAVGSGSAWLLFIIWLFVGITAFIVRLKATPTTGGGGTSIIEDGQPITSALSNPDTPLLAALLFLGLYFATGTVAGVAGYMRHNTAAKQFAQAVRGREEAARIAASSAADLRLAEQTLAALEEERARREEGWVQAQEEWRAIANRLKQEARFRLAGAAQNPSTTDAYFEPPNYLRAGADTGGDSADGVYPQAGYQASSYPQTAPPTYMPPQAYPSAPAAPYPAPPQPYPSQPAVTEAPQPWRLNPSPPPGSHRPVDHGGSAGQERWEGR